MDEMNEMYRDSPGTGEQGKAVSRERRPRRCEENTRFALTEKRLREMRFVKMRVKDSIEEYRTLAAKGIEALRKCDKSMVKLITNNMRLTPEEVHAGQLSYLRRRIMADRHELSVMRKALDAVRADKYFKVLELAYARGMNDTEIAIELKFERSTITRHRRELVGIIAACLYGAGGDETGKK